MSDPTREGKGPPQSSGMPVESRSGQSGRRSSWRDRFPGWETYEGRANDPRFASTLDPHRDKRYDTNLKPSMVVSARQGVAVWILGIAVGILLLILFALLMYYHFPKPLPRSPQGSQATLVAPASARPLDSVVDQVLPLRKGLHAHLELSDYPQPKD